MGLLKGGTIDGEEFESGNLRSLVTVFRTWTTAAVVLCSISISAGSPTAQKKYGPGVSDTKIKLGNIMPYGGPVSAVAVAAGKTAAAFFAMINAQGGINGRRINFISYDDACSAPKQWSKHVS